MVDGQRAGAGSGGLSHGLVDMASQHGQEQIVADRRATNLESSRAYTSFGLRPIVYRLNRALP